ncbi:unnamed protein product [Pleuronectes platessa]|uniref:Uncharacterized protein n=1 Tax=Pleuronectes platessa TaxID=8262 RepID=A0A9N7TT91_PLEPL|nr:unnamed protein product [Pleuronectes platessa]
MAHMPTTIPIPQSHKTQVAEEAGPLGVTCPSATPDMSAEFTSHSAHGRANTGTTSKHLSQATVPLCTGVDWHDSSLPLTSEAFHSFAPAGCASVTCDSLDGAGVTFVVSLHGFVPVTPEAEAPRCAKAASRCFSLRCDRHKVLTWEWMGASCYLRLGAALKRPKEEEGSVTQWKEVHIRKGVQRTEREPPSQHNRLPERLTQDAQQVGNTCKEAMQQKETHGEKFVSLESSQVRMWFVTKLSCTADPLTSGEEAAHEKLSS